MQCQFGLPVAVLMPKWLVFDFGTGLDRKRENWITNKNNY